MGACMAELDAGDLVRGDTVHTRVYTDPAIFALEQERLFGRVWLYLCHESQLPNPGDFVATSLAGTPVIVVRQKEGAIAALINRCSHRGSRVCLSAAGTTQRFRCPYHGWTYGIDGRLMGVPLPGIEYGIAASALLLGAAVAFEVRASLVVTAVLVGVFAIFHGHAHGTELPPGQSALLYSMGFVIATGGLHAVGIGIGTVHRWTWGRYLLRAAGAVVAMGGVFFLWKALV